MAVSEQKIASSEGDNNSSFDLKHQHIIDASAKLFVRQGYHKTTVRQIASESGITVGTLYHYFRSKEDILKLILEKTSISTNRIARETEEILSRFGPTEALRVAIANYFAGVSRGQDQTLFWYQDTRALSKAQSQILLGGETLLAEIFNRVLVAGIKTGEFKDHDTVLMSHNIIVLGDMWAFRRWFLRSHCTFEQYLQEQADFLLSAILKDG